MTTLAIVSMTIWFIGAAIAFYIDFKYLNNPKIKIAREVNAGIWGHGIERQDKLRMAGHDYYEIQRIANKISSRPSIYHRSNLFWIILSISFILAISLVISFPLHQRHQLLDDSQSVCVINTNRHIYYNESSDQYFIINTNDWDIFHIYRIHYIDNDTAKEIIKVAEIVNGWNNSRWE